MKRTILLFLASLVLNIIYAQPCLPEGIYFETQYQIDHFHINYPNCTIIEGDVNICGEDICSLDGLSMITAIGGDLNIGYYECFNPELSSLNGLQNLQQIGGSLVIINSVSLPDLNGLNGLTHIGGDLRIIGCTVGNLTGLNNLQSVNKDLGLGNNYDLTDLNALLNLDYVNGNIAICDNNDLTSIGGLSNINPSSVKNLQITGNESLSNCAVESICDYLASPGGSVSIYSNSTNCNSPVEIAETCGFHIPCLPYGNYFFFSQADIEDFQNNYRECTTLQGDVTITGNDITNLNGLNVITQIGHNLMIRNNPLLGNLSGFDSVDIIGGGLELYSNPNLADIQSLSKVQSIGGDIFMMYNHKLVSLDGLNSVSSVGSSIQISHNNELQSIAGLMGVDSGGFIISIFSNPKLTSLSGLDNIPAQSFWSVNVYFNASLSICDIKSICEYISDPENSSCCWNNAPGCNSTEEIWSECSVGLTKHEMENSFIIFPNPATEYLTIESQIPATINIVSSFGTTFLRQEINSEHSYIDVSKLPAGLYFIRFRSTSKTSVLRFVKI